MKSRMKTATLGAAFAAALASLAACQVVLLGGAGAVGAYAWVAGSLERSYLQPLPTAWEGTMHALRQMKLKVLSARLDAHYGLITTDMPGANETMRIALEKWTNKETKISVRAGIIGDRVFSEKVHDEIARALR
jgi:hypothetical protein